MLTLEQVTREINADNVAIAKVIREQMDSGNDLALRIVNAYEGAIKQHSQEAELEVTELYTMWRDAHVALVMPIAAKLGNPPPGQSNGAAQAGEPSPFDLKPAGPPSKETVLSPSEAPPTGGTDSESADGGSGAPSGGNGAKTRARRSWAQSDIALLARTLAVTAEADKPAAVAKLAAELGRTPDEIAAKAIEFELLPPTAQAIAYTLTDTDKKVLLERLKAVVPNEVSADIQLTMWKYVATEAREIVKLAAQ